MRTSAVYAAVSLLLAVPCFWTDRIQAGDLSSHVYNAWLAQLAEAGNAPGLTIATPTTNVLFDMILGGLFRMLGAGPAQRIAVCLAVLIFGWGAFAFASAVSGRKPWNLIPCFAMLAYGSVFHLGFFNFYMALGMCFWAMALVWQPTSAKVAGAAAMLVLAWTAHALPVMWCLFLCLYYLLGRRFTVRRRAIAFAVSVAGMFVVRYVAMTRFHGRWYAYQILGSTGADQLWFYDGKYLFLMAAVVLLFGLWIVDARHCRTVLTVLTGMPFQFAAMTAAGVAILPTEIFIPGYLSALAFIAERMSLAVAVCVCAAFAVVRPRLASRVTGIALALLFFGFLYRDEQALNRFEDRIDRAVMAVSPGQRIVTPVVDRSLRFNALNHMIDRACVGRCFSFANYEPSTGQFRVRALSGNAFVVGTYARSWAMQTGSYRVKSEDMPLYSSGIDASGQFILNEMKEGDLCGETEWNSL